MSWRLRVDGRWPRWASRGRARPRLPLAGFRRCGERVSAGPGGCEGASGLRRGARGQLRAGVRAVGGGREGSRGAKVGRCVWAAACVWPAQLEAFGDVLQEGRLPGVWGSVRLVVGARSPKGGGL